MTAEKGNKVYNIDGSMKDRYLKEGFDIRDDSGNVIAHSEGKTVPYEKYQEVLNEMESLKAVLNKVESLKDAEEEKPAREKGKGKKTETGEAAEEIKL